jgi:hypothetical protein
LGDVRVTFDHRTPLPAIVLDLIALQCNHQQNCLTYCYNLQSSALIAVIYSLPQGMRFIPVLRYRDVRQAARWLCAAFGFSQHQLVTAMARVTSAISC